MLHDNLAVYINVDGMLYEDEVRALASGDDAFLSPVASPRLVVQDFKNCDCADSDDEFTMVVSADPVMHSAALHQSPQLSATTLSPEMLILESAANDDGELLLCLNLSERARASRSSHISGTDSSCSF